MIFSRVRGKIRPIRTVGPVRSPRKGILDISGHDEDDPDEYHESLNGITRRFATLPVRHVDVSLPS